jgi:3D (Asp-Asp-Asp) domain-containing protein
MIRWLITWYCACWICCGKMPGHPAYGITASGRQAYSGLTVACDKRLLGRTVWIEGMGDRRCDDTGRLIRGRHIDVYVLRHEDAVRLGRQKRKVGVIG